MGKSVDQAILKVTYMLSSISGVEKAENKKVFKEITKGFTWFSPGDPETDKGKAGLQCPGTGSNPAPGRKVPAAA